MVVFSYQNYCAPSKLNNIKIKQIKENLSISQQTEFMECGKEAQEFWLWEKLINHMMIKLKNLAWQLSSLIVGLQLNRWKMSSSLQTLGQGDFQ